MVFNAASLSDLSAVAKSILSLLKYKTVLFEGEMGAGKTTLIKEMILQAGSKDRGASPTFSLVNEYQIPLGKIYHFDLYRVKSEEEALDFGIEEYLDSEHFCFIEWPDTIRRLISENHHTVKILVENNTRIIKFD